MIPYDIFSRLTTELAGNIDFFAVSQEALSKLALYYGIIRIENRFVIIPTKFTTGGEKRKTLLYSDGENQFGAPGFSVDYRTEEGGNVSFDFVFKEGIIVSEEIKRDLKILADILFIMCGRLRLSKMVIKAYATDVLTGLPNVGGYLTYIDELMAKKELQNYNAFYFNLVHFGLVNQRFGNHEADLIIKRYAEILSSWITDGECLGRLGGDNFVAVIRKERTDGFKEQISGVETYGQIGTEKVPVRISANAGILVIDDSVKECGRVIGAAGVALNEARFIRKCQFVYSDRKLQERVAYTKQLVDGFACAIDKRDFLVYYQPKVRSDDEAVVGAEALSRWKTGGSILMPAKFISILEQNGMIRILDFYVLEQTCIDIKSWIDAGIKPVSVSVNFSRKHIGEEHLAERIVEVIDRYGIDHSLIEIEITETVDQAEASFISEFIMNLRNLKVKVSIDDFGSGYSSLNMLRSFPVDIVKLDREFITSLDERDRKVIENVISMINDLGMQPIAEGIETQEQMEYLTSVGCSMFQGFLFDKPIPEALFKDRLKLGSYNIPFMPIEKAK